MIKICSWCESIIGWNFKFKGNSHGICRKCLQEYFPREAALMFPVSCRVGEHKSGVSVPTGGMLIDRPMVESFFKLLPAGLLAVDKNGYISAGASYGNQ
jgi:hypothetical protein